MTHPAHSVWQININAAHVSLLRINFLVVAQNGDRARTIKAIQLIPTDKLRQAMLVFHP